MYTHIYTIYSALCEYCINIWMGTYNRYLTSQLTNVNWWRHLPPTSPLTVLGLIWSRHRNIRMGICMDAYIYFFSYICIFKYMEILTEVLILVINTCIHIDTHICTYICIYTYVDIYTYMLDCTWGPNRQGADFACGRTGFESQPIQTDNLLN